MCVTYVSSTHMRASAIQKLSVSKESSRVAAAFFESTVQVWDLFARKRVTEFETVLAFGGNRLALDGAGRKCAAAAWNKGKHGGVVCYEADTGKLIWHRQDLRHTQRIRFSSTHNAFWCVPESGRTRLLDCEGGRDLDSIAGLADLYDSDYSRDVLLEKRKRDYVLKNGKRRRVPRLTFAILDAVFGRQSIAISESGGPVRCIDSSTGKELWMFLPQRDSHVLKLWFRNADRNFYGVLWHYQTGRFRYLVRFDADSGEATTLCSLDSWEEAYCAKLDCVVTSRGDLINLSEGTILHRLEFPLTDYPRPES